ncbi:hypothetical protein WJX73_005905 [Symbiochloris irregularis]|uniref:Uncharacterized protein n=1 Tax=Symbiochloris irregularis TaxID=706552 RepID=A0AAW1PUK5_9CHLO
MSSYVELSLGRRRALSDLKDLQAVRKNKAARIEAFEDMLGSPGPGLENAQEEAPDSPVRVIAREDFFYMPTSPGRHQQLLTQSASTAGALSLAFGGTRSTAQLGSRPAKRGPRLKLSAVLIRMPDLADDKKISVVSRLLTDIDSVPNRYKAIQALYLSKNYLQSLHGAANFEGNPLACLPNYRAHVLVQLPKLRVLDGQDVTPAETEAANGIVRHESAVLTLMLANACLAHKMRRVIETMSIHMELRALLNAPGAASGRASVSNAARVLQLWDYEQQQSDQEKAVMCDAIRREVALVRRRSMMRKPKSATGAKTAHATWDAAFTQVMLIQQETIAQLVHVLEESHLQSSRWAARKAGHDPGDRRAQAKQEALAKDAARRAEREALIGELRDHLLELAGTMRDDYNGLAQQYEDRLQQLQTQLQQEEDQEDAGDRLAPSSPFAGDRSHDGRFEEGFPYQSSMQDWSARGTHGGEGALSLPVSPEHGSAGSFEFHEPDRDSYLSAQPAMTPPPPVDELRVISANIELQLEEIQGSKFRPSRLSTASDDMAELQAAHQAALQQLQTLQAERSRDAKIEELASRHAQHAMQKALQAWRAHARDRQRISKSSKIMTAEEHYFLELKTRMFGAWQTWHVTVHRPQARALRKAAGHWRSRMLEGALEGWKSRAELRRMQKRLVSSAVWFHVQQLYIKSLQGWVDYLRWRRQRHLQSAQARAMWLARLLTRWRVRAVERAESYHAGQQAADHWHATLSTRALAGWCAHLLRSQDKSKAAAAACRHWNAGCKARAFKGFWRHVQHRRQKQTKASMAAALRRSQVQSNTMRCISAWRLTARINAMIELLLSMAQEKAHVWRMRRIWRAWVRFAAQQRKGSLLADKAAMHAHLQQWHQKLMETGEELVEANEARAALSRHLHESEELADSRLAAAEKDALQQRDMGMKLQTAENELLELFRAAKESEMAQEQLTKDHAEARQLPEQLRQQSPRSFRMTGTMELEERRPATAPVGGEADTDFRDPEPSQETSHSTYGGVAWLKAC